VSTANVVKGIPAVTIVANNVTQLRSCRARLAFKRVVDGDDKLAEQPASALVVSILAEALAPVQTRTTELK